MSAPTFRGPGHGGVSCELHGFNRRHSCGCEWPVDEEHGLDVRAVGPTSWIESGTTGVILGVRPYDEIEFYGPLGAEANT